MESTWAQRTVNRDSAKAFTGYIAKSQGQTFLNMLPSSGTRFFGFLMDGTTDAGNQEGELIVLVYIIRVRMHCKHIIRTRSKGINLTVYACGQNLKL